MFEASAQQTVMTLVGAVAWLLLASGLAACATEPDVPQRPQAVTRASGATHTIFVTSNGWHSGIVLERRDLPSGRIPETADFPGARYLQFGWGDAEYYPAKQATFGMTLRAALFPTPAVVHVAGLTVPPVRRYPKAEIVSLLIDAAGLEHLVEFINASFQRGNRQRATATGPGLYPDSRFYPATGKFHLFNTCNGWSARALASAGLGVRKSGIQTAEELMRQVRPLGRQVQGGAMNFPDINLAAHPRRGL